MPQFVPRERPADRPVLRDSDGEQYRVIAETREPIGIRTVARAVSSAELVAHVVRLDVATGDAHRRRSVQALLALPHFGAKDRRVGTSSIRTHQPGTHGNEATHSHKASN